MLEEVDEFAGPGGLHVLLNNAGIYPTGSLETIALADWRRVFDVNVQGPFLVTRAALPLLRRAGGARVIMIGSTMPLKGVPGALHYATSKMATIGFTRSLARELGPDGVTVNCLVPSMVSTETANALLPDAVESVVADQTIRRYEQPDDLVGTLLFLASDASAMTTGQTILAEGGRAFV
jgi:NAD(P)-dependent dehydrogenase (short-subunit alcohol dehydrogenase family)